MSSCQICRPLLTCLTVLLFPSSVSWGQHQADAGAGLGASLGIEAGWTFGTEQRQGVGIGAEFVTALWVIKERVPVWSTFGYRGVASGEQGWISRPYTELGVWAFASVAVGYGPEFVGGEDVTHLGHLFVGVPAYGFDAFQGNSGKQGEVFYLEPFYRYVLPLFEHPDALTQHHLGVMLKWVSWGL